MISGGWTSRPGAPKQPQIDCVQTCMRGRRARMLCTMLKCEFVNSSSLPAEQTKISTFTRVPGVNLKWSPSLNHCMPSIIVPAVYLLQALDDDGAAPAAAVADGGGADGGVLLGEHVQQRDDDARAAAADGVAQGDGAAKDVHLHQRSDKRWRIR